MTEAKFNEEFRKNCQWRKYVKCRISYGSEANNNLLFLIVHGYSEMF